LIRNHGGSASFIPTGDSRLPADAAILSESQIHHLGATAERRTQKFRSSATNDIDIFIFFKSWLY
jgi:hypothetical protein